MRLAAACLSALLAVGLSACAPRAGAPDGGCVIGDPAASPEVVMVMRLPDGGLVDVAEGAPIALQEPPQGGKVMFVGVRARNVSCVVQLTASFVDEATGRLGGVESRPVVLRPSATTGFGEPDQPVELSNYSNLPACPNGNFRLAQDLYGRPYRVDVLVEDPRGRSVMVSRRVVPECGEPERLQQCLCECGACFSLDRGCAVLVDGGAGGPDGGLNGAPVGDGGFPLPDGGAADGGA